MDRARPADGPLVPVVDLGDRRLSDYRDLNDPAARRRVDAARSIFVVEGRIAVAALLASGHALRSLLVDEHQAVSCAELVAAARRRGAPVYVARHEVVADTVGFALHRGVVAVAHRPEPSDPERVVADAAGTPSAGGGPALVAVLEGLNDHQNIGALFRNAAAFGVGAVLLDPSCADPLYRRSVRVSSGHVLRVPFARLSPWPEAMGRLRAAGFLVVALSPRPAPSSGGLPPVTPLAELARPRRERPTGRAAEGAGGAPPVALVLGAEGPGLTARAMAAVDAVVPVPMAPAVDSLNVATAAAVAFHRLAFPED